jgi:hypothetical protein
MNIRIYLFRDVAENICCGQQTPDVHQIVNRSHQASTGASTVATKRRRSTRTSAVATNGRTSTGVSAVATKRRMSTTASAVAPRRRTSLNRDPAAPGWLTSSCALAVAARRCTSSSGLAVATGEPTATAEADGTRPGLTMFTDGSRLDWGATGYAVGGSQGPYGLQPGSLPPRPWP